MSHTIRRMQADGWTTREIARILRVPVWVVEVAAPRVGATAATVQHGINRLEETGWIGVVRGGNGVRSRYTLYMDPSDGEAADE